MHDGSDYVEQTVKDYMLTRRELGNEARQSLISTPRYSFRNIHHIIDPNKRGFHLCPPSHPMAPHLEGKVSSINGTFAASWPSSSSSELKYSTFFPENIPNPDALLDFFEKCEPIKGLQQDNRALYRNGSMIIEMCENPDRTISTVFPLFRYIDLSSDFRPLNTTYSIVKGEEPQNKATKEHLLAATVTALQNGPPRFDLAEAGKHIVDVAPYLGIPGVKKGIYVLINKDLDLT